MTPKVERAISYEQDSLAIQHLRGNDPAADALKIVKAKYLTPKQKMRALAKIAENLIPYP